MPSLLNRVDKLEEVVGVNTSPDNITVVWGVNSEDKVFILAIHNTVLAGIVKPSIHDTDISDVEFMDLAAKEQRVSVTAISVALSNPDNLVID